MLLSLCEPAHILQTLHSCSHNVWLYGSQQSTQSYQYKRNSFCMHGAYFRHQMIEVNAATPVEKRLAAQQPKTDDVSYIQHGNLSSSH